MAYMTPRDTTGEKGRLKKNFLRAPLKNFCIIIIYYLLILILLLLFINIIIIIIIIIIQTLVKTKKKNSYEYRSTHFNWQKLILIIKNFILNF